jgi:hypothetical protein
MLLFAILSSLGFAQQAQQGDFHFSKIIAISISASDNLSPRLSSELANRLRRIDGVIVNNALADPDYTITVVAIQPDNLLNIVAASFVVTAHVFNRGKAPNLTACVDSSPLARVFGREGAQKWMDSALFISYHGVVTSGSANLESMVDQIAYSVDANIIQSDRDFDFAIWRADKTRK